MNRSDQPPTMTERDIRRWASLCHVIALVGLLGNGIGFLVGPLVVWLVKRNDDPFIDEQGKEALNFQITMVLALIACVPLALLGIGLVLAIVVAIAMVVFPVIAGIRANEGIHYLYPVSIRFVK